MMREEESEEPIDPQHYTGIILVGIGALALLLIAVSVIQIVRNPEDAGLINWMMKTVAGKDAVIGGYFGENKFEIQASEAFQYIFLCIVGLIVLRLITSIFMAFIKQGTALMADANKRKHERDSKSTKKITPPSLHRHS